MGRFRAETKNRLSLYCPRNSGLSTVAIIKGISNGIQRSVKTNAGAILHALLNNDRPVPIETQGLHALLGKNPARAWRKLRDFGVIKLTKGKAKRFQIELTEDYLSLFYLYQFVAKSPRHQNFFVNRPIEDTVKLGECLVNYNAFIEKRCTIKEVLNLTPSEKKMIMDRVKSFFTALKPLPVPCKVSIAEFAGFKFESCRSKKVFIERKEDRACALIIFVTK